MVTRPNVLSTQILFFHANIAIGEEWGGTYGVYGEKRIWYKLGFLWLGISERVIEELSLGLGDGE